MKLLTSTETIHMHGVMMQSIYKFLICKISY